MKAKQNKYFLRFKVHGGSGSMLIIPYDQILKIITDPVNLKSKLYIKGEAAPIYVSTSPDQIESQTNQIEI